MHTSSPTDVSWLPTWAEVVISVGVIVLVAAICIWIIHLIERRSVARVLRQGETVRARQRGTAIGALATGVIYLVVIAAVVAAIAVIFGANSVAAISGSAFVLLVLGFATQRLLADVVSGFFILFEGQYAVGDLVVLDPTIPMGIVEKASLRVTVLRTLSGDTIYLPNSLVKGAHRFAHGERDVEVGVLCDEVDPVARAVSDAATIVAPGGVRFGSAPLITRTDDLDGGLHWVRIRVDVPPGFADMMTGLLIDLIRARCADGLHGDPIVADLDRDVHATYRKVLAGAGNPASGDQAAPPAA